MSSYNRINVKFVGDSKEYLTDILRDEGGFDGYVVSDWSAVNDRVFALSAGLDLEMPLGDYKWKRFLPLWEKSKSLSPKRRQTIAGVRGVSK